MSSSERYIGLMTGTSLDSIDAVLVDFCTPRPSLLAHHSLGLPTQLRDTLLSLTREGHNEINRMMACDRELGLLYHTSVQQLLQQSGIAANSIRAIGSHGQTLRHAPDAALPWTLQIGDPATLAIMSGIPVVADFRRQDMAAGGHGAPLAPGFHAAVFRSREEDRVILNLGGIANITILPRHGDVTGCDTGPANSLLDLWAQRHLQQPFDRHGQWASQGTVQTALLEQWIRQNTWFQQPPPKSTGREMFGLAWMEQHMPAGVASEDLQATLAEFSAATISEAIRSHAPAGTHVYACGGGVNNADLLARISQRLGTTVNSTATLGIDPQCIEATAFAWLARQRMEGLPGNLPAVTGASRSLVLGALYLP
ncbi:MAG: anhydro-N-acetylmuramic acid kinase [Gammaproteobacteria bacterium]|nr:MAG: anhydro-N-acetylmuramic acid kinase [Gammaproteobacteria bacterium]